MSVNGKHTSIVGVIWQHNIVSWVTCDGHKSIMGMVWYKIRASWPCHDNWNNDGHYLKIHQSVMGIIQTKTSWDLYANQSIMGPNWQTNKAARALSEHKAIMGMMRQNKKHAHYLDNINHHGHYMTNTNYSADDKEALALYADQQIVLVMVWNTSNAPYAWSDNRQLIIMGIICQTATNIHWHHI